ncbi:MAG: HEXXH motif-containing putative peptide modification protein [Rickettsiales bacterium]|nr:HEXXH motif-containing putative peptide modification protein [Pseudomonadota bacterium]MDA0966383.1 HEXXH motif-containing putative peptide modification protein [Pseudomonadota bacterium]MDG4544016.1 HEXXH motif-containing putative peptide modification protein [Rickettsiales bacterium]MDG4545510.1 HEXXH motif-containing putative peptide modification protein [Rickettsiales bacterium]MDG4547959.1 HEXXH motif-containing putative peptide modification protein [Rickettsiales bacterium]
MKVRLAEAEFTKDFEFDYDNLQEQLHAQRLSRFAVICAAISDNKNELAKIKEAFHQVMDMDGEQRKFFLDDPAFVRWLDCLTMAVKNSPESLFYVQELANKLDGLMERIEKRRNKNGFTYIKGTSILVQRLDLDPIIKEATPPTYDFEMLEKAYSPSSTVLPTMEQFNDNIGLAFKEIKKCDPKLFELVQSLIQIIGYTPDATFRSCSASRYQGVVYLCGVENSLIDLEESIVHEAAHQLLYKIAELHPITGEDAEKEAVYELPWSGSKRNLFGYYHAFFIYLQLVKYFDHRAKTAGDETAYLERKRELIHRGLMVAARDLAYVPGMTEYGRSLYNHLVDEINALYQTPVLSIVK